MLETSPSYLEKVFANGRRWSHEIEINGVTYSLADTTTVKRGIVQGQDLSIGNTYVSSFETTLIDIDQNTASFLGQSLTYKIGLWLDDEGKNVYWVKVGKFNVSEATKDDRSISIVAYDNMQKANQGFFTSLTGSNSIAAIMSEQCEKIGCSFAGGADNITVDVSNLEGLMIVEVFQYLAALCGKNAYADRDGNIRFKFFEKVNDYTITADRFADPLTIGQDEVQIDRIVCAVDEETQLTSGEETGKTMNISNTLMTQQRLDSIYNNVIKPFSYRSCNIDFVMGDPALDPGDIVTVQDKRGNTYEIPIFLYTITYTGGVACTLESLSQTTEQDNYQFSGTLATKVERYYAEYILTKELVTETIIANEGKFDEINTDIIHVNEELTALKAQIGELDVDEIIADIANIKEAYITKLEAEELYAGKATVGIIEGDVATLKTLISGSATTGDITTIHLTAENTTIDNALIKSAMIESLAFNKITGVDINTTHLTVHSDDGLSQWSDNTIQISDGKITRVQIGKDASDDYNIYIWDAEGKLMFDATGVTENGIQRPIIRDDMVADDANINGKKIDIQSVVTEINEGTTKITSSSIVYDPTGQSLDIAFNEMIDGIQVGSVNLIRNAQTMVYDGYGIGGASAETYYLRDENGNILTDEYGNRLVYS